MGVVTISSSVSRTPLGCSARFSSYERYSIKRPVILAFKTDKTKNTSLVVPHELVPLPIDTPKDSTRKRIRTTKPPKRVKVMSVDEISRCTIDVDYNEAAAKLENLYELSPHSDLSDAEDVNRAVKRGRSRAEKNIEKTDTESCDNVVRSRVDNVKRRLSLQKRIKLSKKSEDKLDTILTRKKIKIEDEDEKVERLVRDYSISTDAVSFDWKRMKIPPVLSSSEHTWLFKLMQPMKALVEVKECMQKDLGHEPSNVQLAKATNICPTQVRKRMEVGQAARFKLIKHNLRLVLFVINKYFQEFANSPNFHDLCQEGVRGLMTSIDRFEPKRKFRLSTYGLFWIRHAIIRSMTVSSFTRVSFGLESVRMEIYKAKLELRIELNRMPTEDEITKRVRISPERHREVMRVTKPVISLHARHSITQEEFINGIADIEGVGGDKQKQPALLRLALDDVLDSLKPKENLVIRQRYGLDGKGDRTLGEIAGNLNISREMVRKHEVKAFMKLKNPARVDYLQRYIKCS